MDEREITSSNEENEKRKRKKKNPYQKESAQLNEAFACDNVPDFLEEKKDAYQARFDLSLDNIDRLKNETKLVHICDEREHHYKEEIVILKKQLEEAMRIEEMMNS